MKIIKPGVNPSKAVAEMLCNCCGCIFEAAKDEFTYVHDQRDGDFWEINCPVEFCNMTLYKYSWK